MNNGEQGTVSVFEKLVFSATRVFALCGAAAVIIGIGVLGLKLLFPGEQTTVSYAEVTNMMAATSSPSDSEAENTPSETATVAIPDDLKPYLSGKKNERVLQGWIEGFSESQKKDFMKNMSQVVQEAKAHKVDPNDAINTYKTLKLKKISSNEIDKYTAIATRVGYIAGVFGLVLILSILSLVLVMLAIERNTRRVAS